MSTVIIIMILLGLCMIVVSFVIKDDNKKTESTPVLNNYMVNQKIELTDKQKEDIKSQINSLIEEQINSIDDRTEASLDRISNTKILEMNEYADTIMNEISRNHNETVFLYDMLNEKAKEVKGTVKDVNLATEQVKKIKSSSVMQNSDEIESAARKDKAKMRLKELSKQSEEVSLEAGVAKIRANSQAEKLTDMMGYEKQIEKEPDITDSQISSFTPLYFNKDISSNENETEKNVDDINNIKSHDDNGDVNSSDNTSKDTVKNEKNRKILELYNMGFTSKEIAQKLEIGTGEAQLVIDLYGKK